MNKLKFAFALLALIATGRIMAWTEIINDTDYRIRFSFRQDMVDDKCWHFGKGNPAGWRILDGNTSYRTDCGAANVRHGFYYQIDMGDGSFVWPNTSDNGIIKLGGIGNSGNMRFTIFRTDSGLLKVKIDHMLTQ